MAVLPAAVINGLVTGSLLGLLGLGIVLIFRTTGVKNFAAGNMSMFSAFRVFLVVMRDFGIPPWLGFILGLGVGALVGLAVYVIVILPRSGFGYLNATFRTLGLFVLLAAIASHLWGASEPYTVPGILPRGTVAVLGLNIGYNQLAAVGATVIFATALFLFFRLSEAGLIMRAVASDPEVAANIGIRVRRVEVQAWVFAGVFAAVVGMLLAPITLLGTEMMNLFLILAFTGVILGSIGSFGGALVGGLILGVAYSLSGVYLNPEMQYTLPPLILLVTLLLRPAGLFGRARVVRV